jgi:AcrR family transcriptional regulator
MLKFRHGKSFSLLSSPMTGPRKQHERSAESAKRLLDATIALISEKGSEKTTVAEIGERAGYSRAMVRHRYGSKEELLEALMDSEFKAKLLQPATGKHAGLDRAMMQIDLMRQQAKKDPELLRAFFILCFEAVGPVPALGQWMRNWFDAYRDAVANALSAGQRDGSVRAKLNVKEEAQNVIVFGAGLGYCWTLAPKSMDFAKELKKWADALRSNWAAADKATAARKK